MTPRPRKTDSSVQTATLMPIAVDVDLIRFEKNLLQIGFFGAHDARDRNRTSRRIEQTVMRNGNKIKVAAEFRGSESLGLPSTTDRDKFIALLKIISEERVRTGVIANPIRFSGYRLIQELGLSRNGEIYEEILRWGKRMTDTTITSEQVVYRAARKEYSDEVLHVFRSFRRTGKSKLNGTDRQEHYEVVLEDWLLENLNQRYVIPEDFNAYKQLTRPTAKGIFGNLHLWFHASQGRPVEKDYNDLCNLLNVAPYPHLSKIRSTMGLALNELVAIKYLSSWDVQKMSSKEGYKIVMFPGEELLSVLNNSRAERREVRVTPEALLLQAPQSAENADGGATSKEAIDQLIAHGVLPARASQLVASFGEDTVLDTVEYLSQQFSEGSRKAVTNPAGLIIYSLENGLPIPAGFVSSREKRIRDEAEDKRRLGEQETLDARLAYREWLDRQQDLLVQERFPGEALDKRLTAIIADIARVDERVRRMAPKAQRDVAYHLLCKETSAEVEMADFEDWLQSPEQRELFG